MNFFWGLSICFFTTSLYAVELRGLRAKQLDQVIPNDFIISSSNTRGRIKVIEETNCSKNPTQVYNCWLLSPLDEVGVVNLKGEEAKSLYNAIPNDFLEGESKEVYHIECFTREILGQTSLYKCHLGY